MATKIQLRRGTAAAWTAANPTLAEGEVAIETDTRRFKVGDGATAWVALAYDLTRGVPLPEAQGGTGAASLVAAVGATPIIATGSTTGRGPADRFADVVNVKDFGAVGDGATDDTTAVQAMLTALGTSPRTIVVDGPCSVSSNFVIPAMQPVRMEGNGAFVGSGVVTYRPWGVVGASAPTVRRTAGDLVIDYGYGTYVLRGAATGASLTQDATRGAYKLTWSSATVGQGVDIQADGTWDLSSADEFAIDIENPRSNMLTGVSIYFSSDATYTAFVNYAFKADFPTGYPHLPRTTLRFKKSALTVAGAPNWAAIKHVEIRFYRTNFVTNAPTELYVYGLWANVTSRPKVILTFDDGSISLYRDIFPIMQAAGVRGTAYIIGSASAHPAAYSATMANLREMFAAGWDLGSHTWSHTRLSPAITSYTRSGTTATMVFAAAHGLSNGNSITIAGADQDEYNGTFTVTVSNSTTITFTVAGVEPDTTARGYFYRALDPAIVRSELRRNRDWLREQGWTRSADHLAYPFSGWDPAVIAIARDELGIRTARVVGASNGGTYPLDVTAGIGSPHMLPGYSLDQGTAAAALAQVDAAISAGTSLVLFGHSINASAPSSTEMLTSEFQALIDGLKARRDAGTLDVVTISEWFDRL